MKYSDLGFSSGNLENIGICDWWTPRPKPIKDSGDGGDSDSSLCRFSDTDSVNGNESTQVVNPHAEKILKQLMSTEKFDRQRARTWYNLGFRNKKEGIAAIDAATDDIVLVLKKWDAGTKRCGSFRCSYKARLEDDDDGSSFLRSMLRYFTVHYKEAKTVADALSTIVTLLLRFRWTSTNDSCRNSSSIWPFLCFIKDNAPKRASAPSTYSPPNKPSRKHGRGADADHEPKPSRKHGRDNGPLDASRCPAKRRKF